MYARVGTCGFHGTSVAGTPERRNWRSVRSTVCRRPRSGGDRHAHRSLPDLARERRELSTLDHRTLRDLGLSDAEVRFEANKPFWRG